MRQASSSRPFSSSPSSRSWPESCRRPPESCRRRVGRRRARAKVALEGQPAPPSLHLVWEVRGRSGLERSSAAAAAFSVQPPDPGSRSSASRLRSLILVLVLVLILILVLVLPRCPRHPSAHFNQRRRRRHLTRLSIYGIGLVPPVTRAPSMNKVRATLQETAAVCFLNSAVARLGPATDRRNVAPRIPNHSSFGPRLASIVRRNMRLYFIALYDIAPTTKGTHRREVAQTAKQRSDI